MRNFVHFTETLNYRLLSVVLGLTVILFTTSFADEFKYSDSWGKQGYTIEQKSATKVVVNYSIEKFSISIAGNNTSEQPCMGWRIFRGS